MAKKRKPRQKTKEAIEQDKLANELRSLTVQCECSNRVPLHAFKGADFTVCLWCGRRVYKDEATKKKYMFIERMKVALSDDED